MILGGTIPSDMFGGILYIIQNNYELYIEGIKYTLLISILGTTLGLFLSMGIVVLRIQEITIRDNRVLQLLKRGAVLISTSYVEFFRGTPMMVQAAIFYYGLSSLGLHLNILLAGVIVVTLNTAAYLTEVLRAGINSIDSGQMEAARAIGLTRGQSFRYVIFPQAIKNMVPALGIELVVNIKDTTIWEKRRRNLLSLYRILCSGRTNIFSTSSNHNQNPFIYRSPDKQRKVLFWSY